MDTSIRFSFADKTQQRPRRPQAEEGDQSAALTPTQCPRAIRGRAKKPRQARTRPRDPLARALRQTQAAMAPKGHREPLWSLWRARAAGREERGPEGVYSPGGRARPIKPFARGPAWQARARNVPAQAPPLWSRSQSYSHVQALDSWQSHESRGQRKPRVARDPSAKATLNPSPGRGLEAGFCGRRVSTWRPETSRRACGRGRAAGVGGSRRHGASLIRRP